jgi:hypothetical protein
MNLSLAPVLSQNKPSPSFALYLRSILTFSNLRLGLPTVFFTSRLRLKFCMNFSCSMRLFLFIISDLFTSTLFGEEIKKFLTLHFFRVLCYFFSLRCKYSHHRSCFESVWTLNGFLQTLSSLQ